MFLPKYSVSHDSWVGSGSSVKQKIKIGLDVKVGAGSTMIESAPSDLTVVGSPSRIIKK